MWLVKEKKILYLLIYCFLCSNTGFRLGVTIDYVCVLGVVTNKVVVFGHSTISKSVISFTVSELFCGVKTGMQVMKTRICYDD